MLNWALTLCDFIHKEVQFENWATSDKIISYFNWFSFQVVDKFPEFQLNPTIWLKLCNFIVGAPKHMIDEALAQSIIFFIYFPHIF